ncbi:hypothetical protein Tco_0801983 [Tanacetum coccineum]|uniref:Uncharacterized protein n=1 Tax=Tanacetum coccineum TaxID=301880 RepID=A0ABQ4ZYE7_9ASTR
MVGGRAKEKLENFANELFNMETGLATHKKLSESAVDFPMSCPTRAHGMKRAIFKSDDDNGGTPTSLVEYIVPVV